MDTIELTQSPAAFYHRLAPEMRLAAGLLILGLLIASFGIWGNLAAAETSSWNSTTGVVERVQITPVPLAKGHYNITARYTYERPDGRPGTGTNMTRLGALRVNSESERDSYEAMYQFGKMLQVRVHPSNPNMAVLQTGSASVAPFTGPSIMWGGILAVIGLLMLTAELNRQGLLK